MITELQKLQLTAERYHKEMRALLQSTLETENKWDNLDIKVQLPHDEMAVYVWLFGRRVSDATWFKVVSPIYLNERHYLPQEWEVPAYRASKAMGTIESLDSFAYCACKVDAPCERHAASWIGDKK